MDAFIGRYRLRTDESGTLILQHPTGLMFDLKADEALELMDFIQVYRKTLIAIERETDTQIKRVVIREPAEQEE
jgi:hypothetical protein